MVRYCTAFGCNNSDTLETRNRGVTFHRFPKNEELRKQWEQKVRRDNWKATSYSSLCSDHFDPEAFDRTGQTVRLHEGAVPTLFNFPKHLQPKQHTRKQPARRHAVSLLEEDVQPGCSRDVISVTTSTSLSNSVIQQDHHYSIDNSPRKLKRSMDELSQKLDNFKKKLKVEQQRVRRLTKRLESMADIISELKRSNLVSDNCLEVLQKCFSGPSLQLILRQLSKSDAGTALTDNTYPPELRAFAITLHFYSAKAYDFVRETFNLALPHPKTINKWFRSVDGSVGFTHQAFSAIKMRAEAAGTKLMCGLVIDEMAIRRQVEFDGTSFVGYVDIGAGLSDDSLPVAKEVLVFLVVSLTERWKIPVAYFLIDGLNGQERMNLLSMCLVKLYEVDAQVVSVTFDGCSANLAMATSLGCKLHCEEPISSFVHPANSDLQVYVIFDPCHMLKLMRNLLADKGTVLNEKGEEIKWDFLVKLQQLQNREGLRLGNKLTQRHIKWEKQKMKVNIAAQSLSSSVADALDFCNSDLCLPEFNGCDATVSYIRLIDRLFDLLNSRNPFAKGFKAPLRVSNVHVWKPFVTEAKTYLWNLRLADGTRVVESNRKTGVIGFIVTMNSIVGLFDKLVNNVSAPLKYVLTYKFSQDHIELFFCAVRGRGGWNNNPTARQFKAAYKQLLMHNDIKRVSTGNCVPQESFELLHISSRLERQEDKVNAIDVVERSQFQHSASSDDSCPAVVDHDYADIASLNPLSAYVENVVAYIAGFVVRKLTAKLMCPDCKAALVYEDGDCNSCLNAGFRENGHALLLLRKNRGGLLKPSDDVVTVCKLCERCFRSMVMLNCSKPSVCNNIKFTLTLEVLSHLINSDVFHCLQEHIMESEPVNNHRVRLLKHICELYFTVRLHHAGKVYTQALQGDKVRSILTKTVIFKGQ